MKTISKKELAVKAAEVLKMYPNQKEVFATTDGQVFLDKNRAELHAKPNKLQAYPFDRFGVSAESSDAPEYDKNAKDTIADVRVLETVEELEVLKTGEGRKTVLASIEDRLKELAEEGKKDETNKSKE